MRKSLLFSVGVAISCYASAAEAPAYLTPGAEQEITTLKSMMARSRAVACRKSTPASAVRKGGTIGNVPVYMKVSGTALDAKPLTEMKDTVLVTSYDYIYLGDNVRNEATVEYDGHGLRKTLKERDLTTRYAYTLDNSCRWLSRLVETKWDDKANWSFKSREERTIENDFVTSVTLYRQADAYDESTEEEYYTGIKSSYYELEYRTGSSSHIENNRIANAAIVKCVEYDNRGNVEREVRRVWYEPAGEYIDVYMRDNYNMSEAVVDGDKVIYTYYSLADGSTPVKVQERIQSYGRIHGSVETYYDENGNVTEMSGSGLETWREASGDSIAVYYVYADGQFVPESKSVYSADYFVPEDYTRDFSRNMQMFNYSNGEWVAGQSYSYTHHLLPNGLSEISDVINGYERSVTAKMEYSVDEYGNEQWKSLPAKVNADGSYVTTEEVSNGSYYLYCYYSAAGDLQKSIKQTFNADVNNEMVFFVMMPGDTDWSVLGEYTTTETQSGMQLRSVFKTNPDGTPCSITEYVTSSKYNNGQEFKSLETVYTYSGNGDYSAKTYEVYSQSDVTKMALSESVEMITLADGTKQLTELEYDDNGKGTVESGYRTETKAGMYRSYTYKTKTGVWDLTGAYCQDDNYTTEDGIEVYISYRMSDDQTAAVPERKTEHKEVLNDENNYTYVMNASYLWDENAGKWVGESKDEENYCYYTFEAFEANEFDPLEAYNDEYMLLVKETYYGDDYRWDHTESYGTRYEWDSDTDSWKPGDGEMRTFSADVAGNKLTTTEIIKSNDWGEVKTETKTEITERDDDMRVVMKESESVEEIVREGESQPEVHKRHSVVYYTYNDKNGLLAETRDVDYEDNGDIASQIIYRYTYTDFTIEVSGIEDAAVEVENPLQIDGRTVSAPGQTIYVYTVGGQVIASGANSVELPEATGMYIVKAGSAVSKVTVR